MKVPSCRCLQGKWFYDLSIQPYINLPIWARESWQSEVGQKLVQLKLNFCPQCGAPYKESED